MTSADIEVAYMRLYSTDILYRNTHIIFVLWTLRWGPGGKQSGLGLDRVMMGKSVFKIFPSFPVRGPPQRLLERASAQAIR